MKTKTAVQRLVVIALAAAAMYGQEGTAPSPGAEDPGGWTKAKWGMTQAQISETFPEARPYLDEYATKPALGLNGIPMGPAGTMSYSVRFYFSK